MILGVYFFALYAGIIWFGVNYFRRRWPAYIVLLVTIPIALAGVQLIRVVVQTDNMILNIVATAYEALILMVGVMIVLCPRRAHAVIPCFRCRYDLAGNTSGTCPECGRAHDIEARRISAGHRHRPSRTTVGGAARHAVSSPP